MQPIRIAGFAGCNLSTQPRLLAPEVGVWCENQKPGRGDFRPWRVPVSVATIPSNRKTLYRFGADVRNDADYWFGLTTFGHFARSFLADDSTERTYFTAATGGLKVTDNTMLAGAPYPTTSRDVGVPAPTTAPTLTQTAAGTGDDETRVYIYVFVNDWGEVSAPSPPSAYFTCKPGALINITTLDTVPGGSHGINKIRIYRTSAGSNTADFFFLREISPAVSSTDDARAVGSDVLPSAGPAGTLGLQWLTPPANLKNILRLWNGMHCGISGKSIRICEPFKPYAWPPAYEVLTDSQPVAIASFGSTAVILTTGTPQLMTGAAPEAMEAPPGTRVLPCESAAGVVSFEHGVVWPSSDGLAYIGASGQAVLLTEGVMTKAQWRAWAPTTMVAGQHDGYYLCFYDTGSTLKGFAIDPLNPTTIFPLTTGYPACYFDRMLGQLYVLDGGTIVKWDAGVTFMAAVHRSKVFRQSRPGNLGVAEVIADAYPVTFKLYAGQWSEAGWSTGALKTTVTVQSRLPFKLPSGYIAEDMQVEIAHTGAVTGVVAARSVAEIRET